MTNNQLAQAAQQVLNNNRKEGFTIPTAKLYPFQWNWDSGFVALGLQHYNLEAALLEIRTLFSGQWQNGMIPHIIFHSEKESTYFPNYDFWQANVNPGAPLKPKTSGISQPPVHGFVLQEIWNNHKHKQKVEDFIRWIFPKIEQSHRFYANKRDPKNEGLFYIYHPWESGRDNSPIWDESMNRIVIKPGSIPHYERKDTAHADASERPTSAHYDRYVYLLELGKKHQYDGADIFEQSPLLIQDVMMNSILIRSTKSMISMGKELNIDTSFFEQQLAKAIINFDQKFWSNKLGFYVSYDMKTEKQIDLKEIGGIVALFSGLPSRKKAEHLNRYLLNLHEKGYNLCPSFDVEHDLFDSKRYWRGPIWCQMNWMVYKGLKDYGFEKAAQIVKNDFLNLVKQQGFYEYFEPQKHVAQHLEKGYGGNHFSWTAAITLDLIHTS